MDKKLIGKYLMMGLGTLLTVGSTLVNAKNQENQMNDTIAKKVEEALKNQAKES